ncbi:MAG TPA: hypothetical protein VFV87_22830 [Pirellulaceae bacterium]|nr:hypothetical protein [Pirellulaceae bacterium]
MSNPLLKPNDPRFQKPSITDAEGQNRFAEGEKSPEGGEVPAGDAFTAGAAADARPYQPTFEATQRPRSRMLLTIAALGFAGVIVGLIALVGIFPAGYAFTLICVVPAATAWLLAYQDLKTMQLGAMDDSGREQTRLAYWLGLFGLVFCTGIVATAIWRQMNLLPDLF